MEPRKLGEYSLLQLIDERDDQRIWLAEQTSVSRPVRLLECIDPTRREGFLAHVRAKAAIDHPLISSIYEAVDGDPCYATLEFINSPTLEERLKNGELLSPREAAQVLRRVAEAMLHLRERGMPRRPLTLHDIHVDAHAVVRLENLARAEAAVPAVSADDVKMLGERMPKLIADALPGTNRVLTVLAWMRGAQLEEPIDWPAVQAYGEEIEKQLQEAHAPTPPIQTKQAKTKPPILPWIIIILAAAAAAAAVYWIDL
jgi:hypothetical protein